MAKTTVPSQYIADNAITTAKIAANAITAAQIAGGAIVSVDLGDNSITVTSIAGNAVGSSEIAANAVGNSQIAANAVDSAEIVSGSIDTVHLSADAVTGAKIADDSIDSEHYVDGSIDTAHIADSQVTNAKLANSSVTVNSNSLSLGGTLTLDTDDIGEGVTNQYFTNARAQSAISAGTGITVSSGEISIAGNAITATMIAANAVGSSEIAANSVDSAEIAANAVSTSELASTAAPTFASITTTGNVGVGGNLTVTGNLQVDGTTTTINSTNLSVDDLNITVAAGAANAAAANGAGITVDTVGATFTYNGTTNIWEFNRSLKINGPTGGSNPQIEFLNTNGVIRGGKNVAGTGTDTIQLLNNGLGIAVKYGGNVGIGTDNPTSKLDVNGVVSLKGNDFLDSDTSSHYIKAPTHLYFYSNGTDLNFSLNNLGNVGIGIASAVGQGSTDKILHLHNTTSNRTQIHLTNSSTGTTSTDGSYISTDSSRQLFFINKEAQGFYFENGTTNSMEINANNVVQIGGGTHSGANQTLGIGNTTGNDPGLQIRTSDGTGTAGYLFADTTNGDNITLESTSGTVNIAGYGGSIMASIGSRPSGTTWTETQLEVFNSAGNSAEFQLNSSNNIKIRFNNTDRATIDSNGNWTINGSNKLFGIEGFLEVERGITIDRANNNAGIWFTNNESDTNHVLWNGYNGNDPQTRGAANSGFDGIFWNVYRGLQIRGGTSGAVDCLKITNSSSNVADHAVRLYASGVERLVTTTSGVNVSGTIGVDSIETMQILQHKEYSNHTSYNSATTGSWISSGFTGTFTRLKSNSSILVKANIALGIALSANSAQNYGAVRTRIDMGNSNLIGDSSNYYHWLRLDVSTVNQHIKETEGHVPLFYSVSEAAGYFGTAGTTTTFTVQYYNQANVGAFGRGGVNVWGNNSTVEIIEYDGGTLS